MKKPGQKFNFDIQRVPSGGGFIVVRLGGPAKQLVVFRASTEAKAEAWLQIYLMLSIPDRRKLRAACA